MTDYPGDYRILVTGSRAWDDAATLGRELGHAVRDSGRHPSDVVIIHGDNRRGADRMADHWAQQQGMRVERYPARWGAPCREKCQPGHRRQRADGTTYCPAAGNYRNAEMVASGVSACVAFYKAGAANRGTADCDDQVTAAGIKPRRVSDGPVARTDYREMLAISGEALRD
jgi:hypothetical protein